MTLPIFYPNPFHILMDFLERSRRGMVTSKTDEDIGVFMKAVNRAHTLCEMFNTPQTPSDRRKEILEELRGRDTSLAVALDGPLGPRHEPKGLAFYFAELLGAEFTGFTLRYSACIRLWRRWDKYAIPLPFSKVTVRAHGYGRVTRKNMPALPAAPRDKNPDFLSGEGSSILGGEKQKIQTAGGNYGNQSYLDRGR